MSDQAEQTTGTAFSEYLKMPVNRAQLLAGIGAGLAAALLPAAAGAQRTGDFTVPFFPQITSGSYTTESIQEILNSVVTAHYLGATGGTMTLSNAAAVGLTGWQLSTQQAAAASEQYRIDFLTSLGAKPVTTAFTFPSGSVSKRAVVLATAEGSATIQVGLHMTAAREFAELGQPTLAKWMYQMGNQVSEQRAIYRTLQAIDGVPTAVPPNNKAFATDLFLYTRDAIALYRALGLIGGSSPAVSYPGRAAVLAAAGPMASAVIQKTPNNATSTITLTGLASVTGERV